MLHRCTATSTPSRAAPPSRRGHLRLVCGALLVALIAACVDIVDPPLPPGAEPFVAPPVYSRWWAMASECSGLTGRLDDVQWYVVPGVSTIDSRGRRARGYWSAGSNRIVLAGSVQYEGAAVRHEMLHALAQRPGHGRDVFLRRCGGVVECASNCIDDAGPAREPDPAALRVESTALEIAVAMSPAEPLGPGGDGFVTLTVTARNPHPHPVELLLPPDLSRAYTYEMSGATVGRGGRASWLDSEVTSFAPGEVKRHVFDVRILIPNAPWLRITPGQYRIRGGYGGRTGPTLVVDID